MVLLLAHAAVIPIHIPLAGALTHPDPFDVDLFTFSIFEGAFICISTAYLLGGLVKDRIATGYQRASLTDPLTGVTNRRGFFQMGERLLMRARFAREPMALIMFDLDQFKRINDRYGHHAGDEVLTAFCKVATTYLRPNDLFGRIGGEEFASLLPDTGLDDAVWLADRTRAAIERMTNEPLLAVSDVIRSGSCKMTDVPEGAGGTGGGAAFNHDGLGGHFLAVVRPSPPG